MARPTSRTPSDDPPQLTPAPDTGTPFSADRSTQAEGESKKRAGRQLGLRIPEDLGERLEAASERTDVPMTKIVIRALRTELDRLDSK